MIGLPSVVRQQVRHPREAHGQLEIRLGAMGDGHVFLCQDRNIGIAQIDTMRRNRWHAENPQGSQMLYRQPLRALSGWVAVHVLRLKPDLSQGWGGNIDTPLYYVHHLDLLLISATTATTDDLNGRILSYIGEGKKPALVGSVAGSSHAPPRLAKTMRPR